MERRSYATFRKLWPEKSVRVTSPRVSLADYLARYSNDALSADDVVSIMVGDLQRVRLYPARGFQIHQDIPDDVWLAYERLVEAGFNRHLVRRLTAWRGAPQKCAQPPRARQERRWVIWPSKPAPHRPGIAVAHRGQVPVAVSRYCRTK